jgi:hypothetical protein
MTATQTRRETFNAEYRRVLASFAPKGPGRTYTGAQQDRARGIARRNIDAAAATGRKCTVCQDEIHEYLPGDYYCACGLR